MSNTEKEEWLAFKAEVDERNRKLREQEKKMKAREERMKARHKEMERSLEKMGFMDVLKRMREVNARQLKSLRDEEA